MRELACQDRHESVRAVLRQGNRVWVACWGFWEPMASQLQRADIDGHDSGGKALPSAYCQGEADQGSCWPVVPAPMHLCRLKHSVAGSGGRDSGNGFASPPSPRHRCQSCLPGKACFNRQCLREVAGVSHGMLSAPLVDKVLPGNAAVDRLVNALTRVAPASCSLATPSHALQGPPGCHSPRPEETLPPCSSRSRQGGVAKWCPFATEAEAQQAGYRKAKDCCEAYKR